MQNSNEYNSINSNLSAIEMVSERISSVLTGDGWNDKDQIKEIDKLYSERQDAIENLSSLSKAFAEIDDEGLNHRMQQLIDLDKNNLDKINEKVNDIRSKLRKLEKQKSVLIYAR